MVKYILPKRRYTASEAAEIILDDMLEEGTDESVEVLEEDETSSYYESSSDEDVSLAQVANKTIPADAEESGVDYDVEHNREWKKKETNQTTIDFTLPEGPMEDHFAHCRTTGDYFLTYFAEEICENILF